MCISVCLCVCVRQCVCGLGENCGVHKGYLKCACVCGCRILSIRVERMV